MDGFRALLRCKVIGSVMNHLHFSFTFCDRNAVSVVFDFSSGFFRQFNSTLAQCLADLVLPFRGINSNLCNSSRKQALIYHFSCLRMLANDTKTNKNIT